MAGIIDEFMKSYGPEVTKQMAANLNVDQTAVRKLLPKLVPVIISGFKVQKDTCGGDGSILYDVAGYLMKGGSATGTTKGKGILGSLLGGLTRRR